MVKITKRNKPQFLKPDEVRDGDMGTIVEAPYVQTADQSKYGRKRTVVTLAIRRTGAIRRLGLNNTSNDSLVEAYSDEGDLWKGKEVRFQKRVEDVRGVERQVLYVRPFLRNTVALELSLATEGR